MWDVYLFHRKFSLRSILKLIISVWTNNILLKLKRNWKRNHSQKKNDFYEPLGQKNDFYEPLGFHRNLSEKHKFRVKVEKESRHWNSFKNHGVKDITLYFLCYDEKGVEEPCSLNQLCTFYESYHGPCDQNKRNSLERKVKCTKPGWSPRTFPETKEEWAPPPHVSLSIA